MSLESKLAGLVLPWWVKLIPYGVILALFAALLLTRATLHDARIQAELDAQTQIAAASAQEARWAQDARAAADAYATKLSAFQPIILRSTEKVREYAQTPAGRAQCLDTDRVSSILQDRAALAAAAESGSDLLQSSPDTSPSANKR